MDAGRARALVLDDEILETRHTQIARHGLRDRDIRTVVHRIAGPRVLRDDGADGHVLPACFRRADDHVRQISAVVEIEIQIEGGRDGLRGRNRAATIVVRAAFQADRLIRTRQMQRAGENADMEVRSVRTAIRRQQTIGRTRRRRRQFVGGDIGDAACRLRRGDRAATAEILFDIGFPRPVRETHIVQQMDRRRACSARRIDDDAVGHEGNVAARRLADRDRAPVTRDTAIG